MDRLSLLFIIFVMTGCANFGASNDNKDELTALSISELLNIPLWEEERVVSVFQSDTNKVSADTINFGLLVPYSQFPAYASEATIAADLAVKLINQSGGIDGKRLVVIRGDNKINSPISAELARTLVTDYRVDVLIGPGTSGSAKDVLQQVANVYDVPVISQAASAVQLTENAAPGLFWRLVANNHQQVRLMLEHLLNDRAHKRISVIAGRDLYSVEIVEGVKQFVTDNAPDVTVDILQLSGQVNLVAMDLSEEVGNIQKSGATGIIVTLPLHQMDTMLKKLAMHWQGDFPEVLTTDVAKPSYLRSANLGPISKCIWSYVSAPSQLNQFLKQQIEQTLNTDPAAYDAAYIYDAVILAAMAKQLELTQGLTFAEAMQNVASTGKPVTYSDYGRISNLLKRHKRLSYSGYSGRVLFDSNGDNVTANLKLYALEELPSSERPCLSPAL